MPGNPLPLKAIHHVELLVGNAKQAAYYYRHTFGFSQLAYAGPETGVKDQASYVLTQGDIRLVVSTPLFPDDPMAEHLRKHGDGVLDIAFEVDDVEVIFARAQDDFPDVHWLKRPSNRPFAGISMHDPSGNVFDLSQAAAEYLGVGLNDVVADVLLPV